MDSSHAPEHAAVYFAPVDPSAPGGLDAAADRLRAWAREVLRPGRPGASATSPEILLRPALPAESGRPGRVASAAGPAYAVLRVPAGPTAASDLPAPPEGVLFAGTVPVVPDRPRLLVMDVDSTLVRQEVVDELAAHAGVQDEVAAVTARAMAGELDFSESLRARVRTLRGLSTEVCSAVGERLVLSPGARRLLDAFGDRGWPVAAVSGGFVQILAPLAADVGLDRHRANDLEVLDEALTGRVRGEIVDAAAKERALRQWCEEFGVRPEDAIAVGDGANDLLMVSAAGLGTAYCAKPALREAADARIDFPRLDAVLDLVGPRV